MPVEDWANFYDTSLLPTGPGYRLAPVKHLAVRAASYRLASFKHITTIHMHFS